MKKFISDLSVFFQNLDYCVVAFMALLIRVITLGASYAEAIMMFALAGVYGYRLYLKSKEIKPLDISVRQELESMKGTLDALKMEKTRRPNETKRYF